MGNLDHSRSFSGAAGCNVSNANDRAWQEELLKNTHLVQLEAPLYGKLVTQGEADKQGKNTRMKEIAEKICDIFGAAKCWFPGLQPFNKKVFYNHTIIKLDKDTIRYYITKNEDS